ncbi:MAG TPA: TauD/TfdA family dioxygenase, partial [Streptosporangiaceae bacterium]
PSCLDSGSGQRLVNITDVPAEVRFGSITEDASSYLVTFEPDGHQAVIAKSWLTAALAPVPAGRTEDAKRLWVAADFDAGPPQGTWTHYLADAHHRAACLTALLDDGFVLLKGVPPRPGIVLEVAASMGFVRETNYGKLFDVQAKVDPANLAFTALAITPHTDNPYRDPVPTVQLLHCLASAAEGGDSGLVDGFAAAGLLRSEDPAAFATLTSTPVTFSYRDATADLRATMPMIGLDPRGRIREIRFNNRSMQPLGSPAGPPAAADADAFYLAYRAFARLLTRPELMLTFRREPGDCIAFDNTRVLHARTAFTAGGHRHLQGCYADLDGVASALAVLRRNDNIPR